MTKRVLVLHQYYGCETGCCGHVVEIDGQAVGTFDFGHPSNSSDDEIREFARQIVTEQAGAEHCADIDFENSVILED